MIFDFISILYPSEQILLEGQSGLQSPTILNELWSHQFNLSHVLGRLDFSPFGFVGDNDAVFCWFLHEFSS